MFYYLIKGIFIPILKVYFRLKTRGRRHVPPAGPCIVAANHGSFVDPFVLGASFPRKVHFLVVKEQYNRWFARWFCDGMEAIPVSRDGLDRKAIRKALDILGRGGVVGIYPEGTRSPDGEIKEFKSGVGLLARKTGAAIVPAGIAGSFEAFPPHAFFPRPASVEVRYGAALDIEEERGRLGGEYSDKSLSAKLRGIVKNLVEGGG